MPKVSIVRCEDYDRERVFEAVKTAVDLVGGMGSFVKPGMKVLLKPNLLSARFPEEAVDTHPEVVRAAARLVKAAGGIPLIGDSPGGYGKNIEEVFTKSGMRQVSEEEGVELVRFRSSRFIEGLPVSRLVFDCECVISIPKFKTHAITGLTAAIKNMYGTVIGLAKASCHSKAPKEEDFAKVIAKVYSISRPHLNILDGVVAMEGDGPSAGIPRPMKMIMAGTDAVAIDACLARLIGIDPLDILVTREAYGMGLGEAEMSRIEVVGGDMQNFAVGDFKLPRTTPLKFIPEPLARGLANLIRFKPHIDSSLCTRCNLCKITCPVNCIEIEEDFCRIDYKKCVRCLCCHEVCPYKAISIKRNALTKIIWG